MKIYTNAEYDRLYRQTLSYEQIETNTRGFDIVRASKSQWDEGKYCNVNLSSGIRLEVIDEQILFDCNKKSEHGDRAGDLNNTFELPSYTRTDASIFYNRDKFKTALNFRNLFDIDYFVNADNDVRVRYGTPFTVIGSLSYEF